MVKFIAGIAIGVALVQFFATNDGKILKEKLTKYISEQTADNDKAISEDTIIDIPNEQE